MKLTKENFYSIYSSLNLKSTNNKIQNIWVGFSGGLDSSVLLYLSYLVFNNKKYKLHALHINHNIHNNADSWQQHCYNVCNKLNIQFHTIQITVNPNLIKDFGLESALRSCRQTSWTQLLEPQDHLLLAHHLNDQAETLFLRLLRGTGLTGISAIYPISILDQIVIIRPLLHFTRDQLEDFAKNNNINYVNDPSNYNQKFARNFLRHNIMPKLTNKWPKYINNIGRTIEHLQKAEQFIKNQATVALSQCYKDPNVKNILIISKLLQFDDFLQTEILRLFITKQGLNAPDTTKLHKIYKEIIAAKIDRQPQLNLRQYVIYRYRDQLYTYSAEYLKNHQLKRQLFSFKTILDDLEIYFGDCIQEISSNKAKKIFQNKGIPPWQRKDYPLVFQQRKLIAIIGLWVK